MGLDHGGRHGAGGTGRSQRDVFGPHAQPQRAGMGRQGPGRHDRASGHVKALAAALRRQKVHARRADEVADKGVLRPFEQIRRAADLHRPAAGHHHHLVGKGQRLDLIVGDVDQRELQLMVDLLELAAQLPLEVGVDHRQRLIEQHRTDILTHQAAAERYLLLGVGRQPGSAHVELAAQLQHLGDLADALGDLVGRHAPVAQRKGQVLGHRHGVVDHRKLEHLGDVALLRCLGVHHLAVELDRALRGHHQARDDVEQAGLAAARRTQQRVGATVFEGHFQGQQRVIAVLLRIGFVAVRQIQVDAGHVSALVADSVLPVPASARRRRRTGRPAPGRGTASAPRPDRRSARR